MIIKVLRYILGYINFRAYNGFADRFINLCVKEGIPLWNIRRVGDRISASTTIDGYLNIRSPAKKSGMRMKVIEKRGLIFFLKRNKLRVGIVIGLALCIIIISVLSQFVWSVSVVGNVAVESDEIIERLSSYGIDVGAKASKEEMRIAAQQLVTDIEKLSWASVNRKGSVIVVEVREKVDAPTMYDNSVPTNVVAKEDGVILSIDVLHGIAEVKTGSAVAKGDLLISGIMTHRDNTETLVHADGHIRGAVEKQYSFTGEGITLYQQSREYKRKQLFFFALKIPLGKAPPSSFYTEHKSFIEGEEIMLPLGIITQYGAEYSQTPLEKTESLDKKIALLCNAINTRDILEYSHIKSSTLIAKNSEFGEEYEFKCVCEQEIGILQEIYVEKNNDNS